MQRDLRHWVLGAGAALALVAAAESHHSYGATYNVNGEVNLEGELVQFRFRNPHVFVEIEAPDEHGEIHRWSVEWSSTAALMRQGIDRATLRPGDHVILMGRPSRAPGERRLLMVRLERPSDGLTWGDRRGEVTD